MKKIEVYKAIFYILKMDLTDSMVYANYAVIALFFTAAAGVAAYGIYKIRKSMKENEPRINSGLEDKIKK